MNILAIDTATEACSVALQYNERVITRFEICPQQHSQRLLPMVDDVLKEANVGLSDIELLAFGRGPGSFTGVRIATGMIQGLALGTGLKVAGVSTLEAMAREAATKSMDKDALIAVASDARMDEVYFAVYSQTDKGVTLRLDEQVCPPEVAIEQLNALGHGVSVITAGTGWAAYDKLTEWRSNSAVAMSQEVTLPNAQYMLTLAVTASENGNVSEAVNVEPVYLRDKVTWKKLPGRE
ncbi:tRNA (adenosine(37)-N6)-threonylcarbamoyltransferase complex dimerization subunit type 1 TsaB [Alteromonas mediterranea]|uniref:tRNA (adenosine(37)-N6)-threonylcarbamoyltransferase complex dimerization subunit type 1 TsaB n=1 Tax=Alteromonas mediterranea TaxID=314275 RepID=UPI002FE11615